MPADRLDEVAAAVNELPGVTHNYSRRHEWNLWFTLTARNTGEIKVQLSQLSSRTGIADIHALPAEKVYKIRVDFKLMNSLDDSINSPQPPTTFSDKAAEMPNNFAPDQQALIRLLQEDLPRAEEPFAALAGKLNWPVEEVIRQVRDWLSSGVIRRFGAVVRHRQIGFSANAMAVFNAPLDRIDEIGSALAGLSEVSHCYRRQPFSGFDYNLFAMFHSRSEKHLRDKITNTARQFSLQCYDILFSEKEYKKTSPKFFV